MQDLSDSPSEALKKEYAAGDAQLYQVLTLIEEQAREHCSLEDVFQQGPKVIYLIENQKAITDIFV